MPQIRSALAERDVEMIQRYSGSLPLNTWVRGELAAFLAEPAPEVPAPPDRGRLSVRVAVNVDEPTKEAYEIAAGDVNLSRWVREVILRRLWERGVRW